MLLSHSSYLVLLLPSPMMLSLVPLLGQCGLWYFAYCRIAQCRIPLFVLWFYFDRICVLRTFFKLFDAMNVSRMISWLYFLISSLAFIFDGLAYFCVFYSLFIVAVSRHFSSFRHQGSCWWCYPRFMGFVNCFSYSWRALLNHVCDGFAHGVDDVVLFL